MEGKQMKNTYPLRVLFLAVALVFATAALPEATATGGDFIENTLYRFCPNPPCTDGYISYSGLIIDSAGNLYGTTIAGGSGGGGTVFRLAPSTNGWTETVLYNFCLQSACADGNGPVAGLIMDEAGNLYGTTVGGGTYGGGIVFKLAPSANGWAETVLYSFCAQSNCADGRGPNDLIMDGAGNLYGTTYYGGANCIADDGCGTVFKLTPAGSETVLYSFCSRSDCADGRLPGVGLIMDSAGNLYGTTEAGGGVTYGGGTVFKLAPTTNGWTETVLYSFCPQGRLNCTDGDSPRAGLIMDSGGQSLWHDPLWGQLRRRQPWLWQWHRFQARADYRRLDRDRPLHFLLAGRQQMHRW
jgi:uncharacterized repeat protein (TIGR03803 family)